MLGDCFEANGRYLLQHMDEDLVLVHALVTRRTDGVKHGHCFLIRGDTVLDFSNGGSLVLPKIVYYALGDIGEEVYEYTPREFREKILEHEHWGPWDLEYEIPEGTSIM